MCSPVPNSKKWFHNVPVRLSVGIMLLMASFTSYLLRVNMSINILGMVHPKHHHNHTNATFLHDYGPRYNWTVPEQSVLLGAYFWGYLITQLPGGLLSEWYGGRHVIGYALSLSGIATCLVPISAKISFWLVFAVRLITGAFGGFIYPSMQNVIAKWSPADEKGKFVSTLVGGSLGTVVTWPVAGFLMQHLGWAWAFYIPALFTFIITAVWYYCVYNNPDEHPGISQQEKEYIAANLGHTAPSQKKKSMPPIKSLLFSMPCWSLLFLHYGSMWGFYFLITGAPKFMNEVLHFDLANSGFLASLPYLLRFIFSFIFASIGDKIRKRNRLSVTATRKWFTVFSHIIPGLLLLAMSYTKHNPATCVALITLSLGFNGASAVTNLQNAQDLTPNYAASLFAMVNIVATTSGFLSPMLVAFYISENNTIDQWTKVFQINAIFYVVPAVIFILCGSGKIQKWNDNAMKLPTEGPVESVQETYRKMSTDEFVTVPARTVKENS